MNVKNKFYPSQKNMFLKNNEKLFLIFVVNVRGTHVRAVKG